MAQPLRAVVFDWGGTLTPHHSVDLLDLWRVAAAELAAQASADVDRIARVLADVERRWWDEATRTGCSGTTAELLGRATAETGLAVGAAVREAAVRAHLDAWTPHTLARPEAAGVLRELRAHGLRLGLLSNTHWPREWHERWLVRDGLADLLDARVYTSELTHVKPHPEAFAAVLDQLDVPAEEAVFVGDRPLDDIAGAKAAGLRAVLMVDGVRRGLVPDHPVEPDALLDQLAELPSLVEKWLS